MSDKPIKQIVLTPRKGSILHELETVKKRNLVLESALTGLISDAMDFAIDPCDLCSYISRVNKISLSKLCNGGSCESRVYNAIITKAEEG